MQRPPSLPPHEIAPPSGATIRHPAEVLIPAWASIDGITPQLAYLLRTLCLTSHGKRNKALRYLATALDTISDCEEPLARWRVAGEETFGLHAIACAWSARRNSSGKDVIRRPHPNVIPPVAESLLNGDLKVDDHYLYYLLQAKLPGLCSREAHSNLVAWTLVKALSLASSGYRKSSYLREVSKTLRLAAYEDGQNSERTTLIKEIAGKPCSYLELNARLGAWSSPSHRRVEQLTEAIRAFERLARNEPGGEKDAASESTVPNPVAVRDGAISEGAVPASGGFWDNDGDEPTFLVEEVAADQSDDSAEQGTIAVIVSVEPKDAPALQLAKSRGIQLLAASEARFLPWEWSRPNPPEVQRLWNLVNKTLEDPTATLASRVLASLTSLALTSSQSLDGMARTPINDAMPPHPWHLDLRSREFVRQPPRRIGHWKPREGSAVEGLLRPGAESLRWSLSQGQIAPLVEVSRRHKADTLVYAMQFWESVGDSSLRQAFRDWVTRSPATARIWPGMLGRHEPQRIFESTGDHVLSRLAGATATSGLPASTAYCAYTSDDAATPLAMISPSANVNVAGSRMNLIDDSFLREGFARAYRDVCLLADSGDWVDHHNKLSLYWDAVLRAATGARPTNGMWSRQRCINWRDAFAYVDDKASPTGHSGRLIPLPTGLLETLRKDFVDVHLADIRARLDWHPQAIGPPESDADGATPDFLFMIERTPGGITVREVTNLDRQALSIEGALPLRIFRHRLRTRLHAAGADIESVDAIFGHSDGSSLTHGAFSMRVWVDDMTALRPHLARQIELLAIASPTTTCRQAVDVREKAAPPKPRPVARQAARQAFRRQTLEVVRQHLAPKSPGIETPIGRPKGLAGLDRLLNGLLSLSANEIDALNRELVQGKSGMPATLGRLRSAVLTDLARRAWRRFGKWIARRRRYLSTEIESSPFTPSAISSQGLLERIRARSSIT